VTVPDETTQQITVWLAGWRQGDAAAADRLLRAVHPQLRRIAARYLDNERRDHTLEPNALVNELWVRLLGGQAVDYRDRAHFFALAAQTMRRILIDYARSRLAGKRGQQQQRLSLTAIEGWNPIVYSEDLLVLDEALSQLEQADARAARVVELRFFGGLEGAEIADVLGISEKTVKRDWKVARAWLAGRLEPEQ
jgi:RNA polymerase sigma factor (TIGR02999 family)